MPNMSKSSRSRKISTSLIVRTGSFDQEKTRHDRTTSVQKQVNDPESVQRQDLNFQTVHKMVTELGSSQRQSP